jgi:anthranilate phosphoribosyltransferase
MMKDYLQKLTEGKDLTRDEMYDAILTIMKNESAPAMTGAFLTALSIKGEKPEEIVGAVRAMLDVAEIIEPGYDVLDIVGTGGDRSFSFNISSASAIVAAACGVKVAKHGNRSVSSKCGSGDFYEALGVKFDFPAKYAKPVLDKAGIVFMFAPVYHQAMRFVGPIRKELGIKTMYNIMGPLINPMNATHMVLGVYKKELVRPVAEVLQKRGLKHAMVVFGEDVVDEISIAAKTYVAEFEGNGEIKEYELSPVDYGFKLAKHEDIIGGDPSVNKKIALDIFNGVKGPKRDVVVLNAACAVHVYKGVSIEEAIKEVEAAIDSGLALKQLDKLVEVTNDIR